MNKGKYICIRISEKLMTKFNTKLYHKTWDKFNREIWHKLMNIQDKLYENIFDKIIKRGDKIWNE